MADLLGVPIPVNCRYSAPAWKALLLMTRTHTPDTIRASRGMRDAAPRTSINGTEAVFCSTQRSAKVFVISNSWNTLS